MTCESIRITEDLELLVWRLVYHLNCPYEKVRFLTYVSEGIRNFVAENWS